MSFFRNDLGRLNSPYSKKSFPTEEKFDQETLTTCFQQMLWFRLVEETIADLVRQGEAKCPCHLGVGQEAVPAGVSHFLRSTDRVFGAHRSHGHYLALGGSAEALFAEVLGRSGGCSKGMGGSMHIFAQDKGFYGSVPIVAGTIPLALGAALAAQKDKKGDIAVAYFGDGACEEGIVHECLNIAAVMQLPILFLVENNLFSSHLDIEFRQPSNKVARFAEAHHIVCKTIDGNNIIEVLETAETIISSIRRSPHPAFIEAITYRWSGHVGANEDINVGVHRNLEELNTWKKQDPIEWCYLLLEKKRFFSREKYVALVDTYRRELEGSLEKARSSPYPHPQDLLRHVYY